MRVVAFGTLGQGLLTDGLTAERFAKIRLAKMTGLKAEQLTELREVISELARKHETSMAQVRGSE